MDKPENEDIDDVMSAIRNMVRKEMRANFSGNTPSQNVQEKVRLKPVNKVPKRANLPAKVLILYPHMQINRPDPNVFVLDKSARVPHDTPIAIDESFAIANTAIDEGLLRDIVREVVQEQLRGELGKEIVNAVKRDMVRLLENKR